MRYVLVRRRRADNATRELREAHFVQFQPRELGPERR
jgi:hypothetical protein